MSQNEYSSYWESWKPYLVKSAIAIGIYGFALVTYAEIISRVKG